MRLLGRRVLISVGILGVCLPLSFVAGIVTVPFWSWLENRFGIEAVGHSGPAEWCYWTIYGLAAAAGLRGYWRIERWAREKP
jgi:hypothetical protein